MALDDKFEIVRAIHIGQVSTAYEAIQRALDRRVFLKVIHPQWSSDPELEGRFIREGKAIAKVTHHNVVKIFDLGIDEGLLYLVIEWIEGGTLKEKLAEGPLSQGEVKKIAWEVLDGLSAVHEAGFLHRDIKPDNIMLGPDDQARLTDFSLAGIGNLSTLTAHDGIVGSPAYMSPELIAGEPPSVQNDLYALGVVLVEALTGSNPFDAGDPILTLDKVRKHKLPSLLGRQNFDEGLARLIDSLLGIGSSTRPASALEARQLLFGAPASATKVELKPVDDPAIAEVPIATSFNWRLPAFASIGILFLVILWFALVKREPIEVIPLFPDSSAVAVTGDESVNRSDSLPNEPIVDQKAEEIPKKSDGLVSAPLDSGSLTNKPDIVQSDSFLVSLIIEPWGAVKIDDRDRGVSPVNPFYLKKGTHKLEVSHPDFPLYQKTIEVKEENLKIHIDLKALGAELYFAATSWGYLLIDGDSIGLLPRSEPVWLPAGRHRIRVVNPSFDPFEENIEVASGVPVHYRIDLSNGTLIAIPSE